MATGTGNLPYPGKVYVPFDILTAQELNEDVANIESLATGTGIGDGAIGTAAIANNGVTAAKLATNAITLGYAQITSNYSTSSTSASNAVTGLSTTVTIPSGGRRVRVTAYCPSLLVTTLANYAILTIWDGTVGSGTLIGRGVVGSLSTNAELPVMASAISTPSAGSKTYNVGLYNASSATNVQINAAATYPAYILVEAI